MFSTSNALVVSKVRALPPGPVGGQQMSPVALSLLYRTARGGCPGRGVRVRMADGGRGVSIRVLVQVTELAADDIGQRMRQGVEDRGGLQIAGPRGLEVAAAEQDVTQPGQRVALAERRADLAVGIDGLLVMGLSPG